jgi:hypothetical protein
LEGEAFFQVVHNSLPFVVKTGQLLTRVLGTSFTVKANEQDENITVTVKTGKVSVQSVPGEAGSDVTAEVLTPNQQAVYNIIKRTFSKRELAGQLTRPSNPPAGRRRFHEAPVTEIFHAVSALFGTPIIFDEEGLQRCMLSTSVSPDENIFYRVDIICKAIGATYKIDDGSIVVDGACSGVVKPDEIDP